MLNFFSKKTKDNLKKDGLDNTVDSSAIVGDINTSEQDPNKDVHTQIHYHPSWNIDNEQRYVLNFLNNDLPPLKPNQLSLSGIELSRTPKVLVVSTFVRSSLPKAIKLEELPLILLDENQDIIAKHVFDGNELGEIPAESSMPWQFLFPKETIRKKDFSNKNWTLAFDLSYSKHKLDLHEAWEKSLSQEQKEKLNKLIEQLPKLKENELNLTALNAKVLDNGDFQVTVLIRNGFNKHIKLEKVPLRVTDAVGDIVTEGSFTLEDFIVKANTSKPWTFVFPASLIRKNNMDFSSWKVSFIH